MGRLGNLGDLETMTIHQTADNVTGMYMKVITALKMMQHKNCFMKSSFQQLPAHEECLTYDAPMSQTNSLPHPFVTPSKDSVLFHLATNMEGAWPSSCTDRSSLRCMEWFCSLHTSVSGGN